MHTDDSRNSKLLEYFRSRSIGRGFLIPDYGRYCISGIPGTLARLLGGDNLGLPELPDDCLPELPDNPIILMLTIDALGYYQLLNALQKGLSLPVEKGLLTPLTSVFPATTATALTTLNTGASPARHGVLGCRTWVPEYGTLLNILTMGPEGVPGGDWIIRQGGLDIDQFINTSTMHTRMRNAGLNALTLMREEFIGKGITHILARGARQERIITLTDLFINARTAVEKAGEVPQEGGQHAESALINAYWGIPDRLAHVYGIDSEQFHEECQQLVIALKRLFLHKLPPHALKRTVIIITADHGQVPVPHIYRLDEHPELMSCLHGPPSGEYRATFLHSLPGRTEKALNYINSNFEGMWALPTSRLIEEGFFGDKTGPGLYRAGDITVLSEPGFCLQYTFRQSSRPSKSICHHGATTEKELIVPFFVAPADRLI